MSGHTTRAGADQEETYGSYPLERVALLDVQDQASLGQTHLGLTVDRVGRRG